MNIYLDEEKIKNEMNSPFFNNERIEIPNHEFQNIINETDFTSLFLLDSFPLPFPFPENEENKTKREDINSSPKKRGRKKKDSGEKGGHNKYTHDIIIRKIKSILFKYLISFINIKIKENYGNNYDKKLLNLSSDQILINTKENKMLLKKKLKDILSGNISGRFTNPKHDKKHNKNLIQNLLNEEDEKKRNVFEKIFNLTFLDVLKHFRAVKAEEIVEELNGLKTLKDVEYSKDDDEDYKKYFEDFVNEFEDKINGKKERNPKKNKKNLLCESILI